ncbi:MULTISPECIES: DUF4394 domain-containing protein [unclassified Siphonobacter]|uniref:DUF4394 domain-containing protein n=1 Tax=unclassified Siphonobacter TaxID=2635712 RepID=UPI002789328C|nr:MULTISPECIES: DUF4394 domain-containing protein [unclassified Siphonobacter]MDQ1089522.1 3D (Asp-Asp-Asp) domain-containing protein [Siphonobacter sp. SORGH_AS_1065]MDR6195763.1 3D (Asp-Asp-Asp) domain-containing protein [Siphonobacter sp. SORGH_AS_0500]
MVHLYRGIRQLGAVVTLAALVSLQSCMDHRTPPSPLPNQIFYGLTTDNQLQQISTLSPNAPLRSFKVAVPDGEKVLAIDFRPATGQLYAVTNASKLYTINLASDGSAGRATLVKALSTAINGTEVAFDFNPTVDRIRLVTNTGQNLRLHPETGDVAAIDGTINGVSGATITAAAYTNSRAGVTTTTLYDIDPVTDRLYKQDPPNNGTLVPVGSLGLNVEAVGGFDISPDNSFTLASVKVEGKWEIAQVDVGNGSLKKLGDLDRELLGIALVPQPVAYSIDAVTNELLIFDPANASAVTTKAITGLQTGERVLGIDFRPATGQLYALGSNSRIYVINTSSGAAAPVGSGALSVALQGTDFGFDFNPVADRIRIISNTGQNLRVEPSTLVATVDGTINPGTPSVTASAYTNNYAGATATTLYNFDTNTDILYRQVPPNDGTLVPVGPSGVDALGNNGFDIGGTTGMAYAILQSGGSTLLYKVDLTTGKATQVSAPLKSARGFALGLGF